MRRLSLAAVWWRRASPWASPGGRWPRSPRSRLRCITSSARTAPTHDRVRRALGAPDRGAVGRPHQGRDLSLDVARRRAARALQPGARRRRRHRLDPARLHARRVPAHRGVRAADRASRQRRGDLARDPGRVRSDRAGFRGRPSDPDLRPCRPGAPHGRQADPQGRGPRRAEAAHPVAHRRDADRGVGRPAGRHAGAGAAPGALARRGRRRAGALRDRAAAQGP